MLRAEILKVTSHRFVWIVYAGYCGLQALACGLAATFSEGSRFDPVMIAFAVNSVAGMIFTTIVAAWMGGNEFGWGTWRVLLGRDDRRSLFFGTKIIVLVGIVAAGTIAAIVCGAAVGTLLAVLSGLRIEFGGIGRTVAAAALGQAVVGLIAFSIAMATRSFAAGIAVGLGWFLIVENLLSALRDVGPFLLSVSVDTVTAPPLDSATTDEGAIFAALYQIGTVRAWVQIVVWVGLAVGAAWLLFTRRDVVEST